MDAEPREPKLTKLDRELAETEEGTTLQDEAFLKSVIMQDLWVKTRCELLRKFPLQQHFTDKDGEIYAQPGTGDDGRTQENFYEIIKQVPNRNNPILTYTTHERQVIRVPQCKIIEVDRKPGTELFLTISSCSCLTGFTQDKMIVAHVGLSEKSAVDRTVEHFKQKGIPPENIIAIISTPKPEDEKRRAGKTPHFDYSHARYDDFLSLGITPDHIYQFETKIKGGLNVDGQSERKYINLAGVLVNTKYVYAFLFDETTTTKDGREENAYSEAGESILFPANS